MKNRIAYLDCLRGISMLMVVFCHVQQFCLGYQDHELVACLFNSCMLPLFFFVSGIFTPPTFLNNLIINRLRYVLLPTVVMFLLYVGVCDGGYQRLWLLVGSEYKYGYWFTIVLFEMNLIHYLLQSVVRHKVGLFCALTGIAALLIMAKDWDWYHNGAFLSRWLCLRLLAQYFPYYVVGILCMAYSGMFHKLLANEYIVGGLVALFAALYVYPGSGFYKALLMGFVGTFAMYQLCRHYQDVLSQATFFGRQLQLIGRSTLSIYLIHYFFIQGVRMPWLREHLTIASQGWVIAAVTAVVAIMIVYASLAVAAMLKVSTPLYRVMLGK